MYLPLAARLRAATQPLHTEVERTGLMRRLLGGRMGRQDYAVLLRNLQAIYAAMEAGLQAHAGHPQLAPLMQPGLMRGDALAGDLAQLQGDAAADAAEPVPAARDYAQHLRTLAQTDPGLLAAHAYVRYLGDLSGGQAVARVVTRSLGLAAGEAVAFYAFGPPDQVARMAGGLRAGLDRIATSEAMADALVDEACAAFARHRALFDELERGAEPAEA